MATEVDARMGVFDSVLWGVETDPLLRSVVIAVVFLDREPDEQVVRERTEEMSLRVPRLRRRVVGNPVSLVPPRWEKADFDLGHHLQFRKAPGKGDRQAVLDVAEHLAEQDFDRARPLWEAWIITGMEDGKAAAIMKIHHAITDGVGGMAMAAALFDLTDDPSQRPDIPMPEFEEIEEEAGAGDRVAEAAEWQTKRVVGQAKSVASKGAEMAGSAVSDPMGAAKSGADFAASAARVLAPANNPMSPVMRGRSLGLHFAIVEIPVDVLKKAGKRNGGSLNDAFMAIVTGGIARYHAQHGVSLEDCPAVRVNMPVNLRTAADAALGGNRWVPARFALPLTPPKASDRIRELSPLLKQQATEPALEISEHVFRLLTSLPRSAMTALSGGMMKGTDVAATNVPGPPIPIYMAGAQVEAVVPFAPKGGAAMNVGLMSYNGTAFLGINLDTAAIYDYDVMVECFNEAVAEVAGLGAEESD